MPLNHGLIDNLGLSLPRLHHSLEGFRIAHVSDLHVTRSPARFDRMVRQLSRVQLDMVFLTGDYMTKSGQEQAALQVLTALCQQVKPRFGFYGVFGNHDSEALRELADGLPIHWLHDRAVAHDQLPLILLGSNESDAVHPDSVAFARVFDECMAQMQEVNKGLAVAQAMTVSESKPMPTHGGHRAISFSPDRPQGSVSPYRRNESKILQPITTVPVDQRLRIFLSHSPVILPVVSDIGMDILFAGHTHGGQIRLPFNQAVFNSTDLPLHLTSGLLRHRNTLAIVTRGVGTNGLPLRIFCPPHIPLVTLRSGPMPGKKTDEIDNIAPW